MSQFRIQNITFFDNRQECITHWNKTFFLKKALYSIQSFVTVIPFVCRRIFRHPGTPAYAKDKALLSKKLVVCLHGLNDGPKQFGKIVREINKLSPTDTDLYIPHIYKKGNGKLDEMIPPILQPIQKWAATDGEKELVLVGISNGGRIARALEAELYLSGNLRNIHKIRFISIVGANQGSIQINRINQFHLSWLTSKNIAKEMPADSKRNKRLNDDWEKSLLKTPNIEREYILIASPHDSIIPNKSSTLLDVKDQPARYALVPGHGHNSIVNVCASVVARIIDCH